MSQNKAKYTATHTKARYVGKHPHIAGKTGVYYWNAEQNSFIFRPIAEDDEGKVDWYRTHRENLVDIE